jgi:hypothetical protein
MKTSVKAMTVGIFACALPAQVFAFEQLNGTIPAGTAPVVIIQPNKQSSASATGVLKFKFSAPAVNAGVPYALSFCIGPESNPCGLPTSYVVNVPAGEDRLAVVDASIFATNELVVGQGTRVAVPFSVQIE